MSGRREVCVLCVHGLPQRHVATWLQSPVDHDIDIIQVGIVVGSVSRNALVGWKKVRNVSASLMCKFN